MTRRPTLAGRVFLWLLDRACLHTHEACWKFGGIMHSGIEARVCEKPRWHWDSHAYDTESAVREKWKGGNPYDRA